MKENGLDTIKIDELEKLITEKKEGLGKITDFWDKQNFEKEMNSKLNLLISSYLEKFFKAKFGNETQYVAQVIKKINIENLPIYDNNGELLNLDQILLEIQSPSKIGQTINPLNAAKKALEGSTTDTVREASEQEALNQNPENIKEGETKDD